MNGLNKAKKLSLNTKRSLISLFFKYTDYFVIPSPTKYNLI